MKPTDTTTAACVVAYSFPTLSIRYRRDESGSLNCNTKRTHWEAVTNAEYYRAKWCGQLVEYEMVVTIKVDAKTDKKIPRLDEIGMLHHYPFWRYSVSHDSRSWTHLT